MSLLPIHLLGDPILREETIPVTEFNDQLRTLVDDMFETMYAASGIGIAAPQVGRRERLAVVDVEGEKYTIINPEIVLAEGKAKAEEACLSFPEVYGTVERATRVIVRAQDVNGAPFEVEATDLLARCFQHEIDHLHGKLFIDYLSYLKRRAALAEWEELRKQYPGNVHNLKVGQVAEHDPAHPESEM
jgi:peptide deformylase